MGGIDAKPIPLAIIAVIQRLTRGLSANDWVVDRFDRGLEADLYALRSAAPHPPVLETYRSIAIKLYKPESADIELVHREFQLLAWLHAALDGGDIDGWKLSVPLPLEVCESPVALVMSVVPGKTLNLWLESGELRRELLHSLHYAIIAAANKLWSIGQVHGDLTFDNILCDIETCDLSFVDPGIRTICPFQNDPTGRWKPPAHDLAHMLHDVGASVLTTLLNPRAFGRKRRFAEGLVQEFIAKIGQVEERRSQLEEIRACAQLHLMTLGSGRLSLRRVYHRLQRQVGLLRVRNVISRGSADVGLSPIPSRRFPFLHGGLANLRIGSETARRCKG
jgi:tRNA A-37 threonylcarbamoyl transferase component Bud32